MAQRICTFKPIDHKEGSMNNGQEMHMTAFVGSKEMGNNCIQFTIGMSYCQLSEQQAFRLYRNIEKRLRQDDGFTATDGLSKEPLIGYDGKEITK